MRQLTAYKAARAAGVNLAFFASDVATWQARYQSNHRTLVEYRSASADPENSIDPELDTIRFADLSPTPLPPCQLEGLQYTNGIASPKNGALGWAYHVQSAWLQHPWFKRTGIHASTRLADAAGYEWDSIVPRCRVPRLTRYFTSRGSTPSGLDPAVAVSYAAASGARVFASGDVQFNWLLDDYKVLQQTCASCGSPGAANRTAQRFTVNLLDDLSHPAKSRHKSGH